MKKLIFLVLLPLFIIVALVIAPIEYSLRAIPDDFKMEKKYLDENAERIKILVLGASAASMGIIPSEFDESMQPAFNCAYVIQSYDFDYLKFSKYIERMDSLQYVIISVGYGTLYNDAVSPGKSTESNIKKYQITFGYDYYFRPKDCLECSVGIERIINRIQHPTVDYVTKDPDGYQGHFYVDVPYNDSIWKESGIKLAKESTCNIKDCQKVSYDRNLIYLIKIIEACDKKDVYVILINFPLHHYLYDNLDSNLIAEMNHTIENLTSSYKNVIYLDFSRSKDFPVEEMYNVNHLNRKGAVHFTDSLNDIIISGKLTTYQNDCFIK